MNEMVKAFNEKVNLQSNIRTSHQAELLIAINSDGTMIITKNRNGKLGSIDLPKLLELLLPYQDTYKPLLTEWIAKLKKLRAFQ